MKQSQAFIHPHLTKTGMQNLELSLTPYGKLVIDLRGKANPVYSELEEEIKAAFDNSQGKGLFTLAASEKEGSISSSLTYWKDFASLYLSELCRIPELSKDKHKTIDPPADQELEKFVSTAPLMQGAEYLCIDILVQLWYTIDEWIEREIATSKSGLKDWLKENASLWHQVGRVCFHLAENNKDPQFPFAFLATFSPQVSKTGRVQYQPLSRALKVYAGEGNKDALINLLSPVQRAAEESELVREIVESGDLFHPLAWTPSQALSFLQEVPVLERNGLLVRLPDWWRKRQRPRVSITIGEQRQTTLSEDSLLDFNIDLVLCGEKLSKKELEELINSEEGLVLLKGQWIEVNAEKLKEALEHWERVEIETRAGGISFIDGMRLLAGAPTDFSSEIGEEDDVGDWSDIVAGQWLKSVLTKLRNPTTFNLIGDVSNSKLIKAKAQKNFKGTLRPYQEVGCDWLWFLSNLGLGACLADDMGLGKTIQILSLLNRMKEEKKTPKKASLLVLPASLLANWKSEIELFTPRIKTCFVHPSQCDSRELAKLSSESSQALEDVDLVLTTYGMLLRKKWLLEIDWRLVILDEERAIKNPSARQAKVVKELKSEARIALTGTPVENRLLDLWSLFDFLCPGLLGSVNQFKSFTKSLTKREHDTYLPLRNLVSPYILRRLKTDKSIIKDLPDKTEVKTYCGLTKRQAVLYAKTVEDMASMLQLAEGIQRRGIILSCLMKFKQILNHPSHLFSDGIYDPKDSGKFLRLKSICDEIASRQEKVLIFSQFREIISPISIFLSEVFSRPGLVLHGGTVVKKRKELVDQFQSDQGPPFMVLSLKAGGTGLNLTAASHVIHFDRWWNPAVENQATDRAYRIGQRRNVLVHKFLCSGTIEEKIDKLIEEKTALAEGILTGGAENLLTEMSDKELLDIVSLDIERASLGEL